MSFFVDLQRIAKSGFLNFWRNGVVSLASILVYTVTLFVVITLVLGSAVFNATLAEIKDKVDITIYFKIDAAESEILRLKDAVVARSEVKEVVYKTRGEVLDEFRTAHANDPLILQSLDELGADNPLRAELTIKAKDPTQYGAIVKYLEGESSSLEVNRGSTVIDKINFEDNEVAIKRFTAVTNSIEDLGLVAALIAAFIAVLVAFNTIRLAIYTSREEISVMRLVGAGDNYIRGPFIVEGILYGLVSGLFTLAIYYPISKWISTSTENFYGGINLFDYYIRNLPLLFAIVMGAGVLLGIIASFLAVRRYLRV